MQHCWGKLAGFYFINYALQVLYYLQSPKKNLQAVSGWSGKILALKPIQVFREVYDPQSNSSKETQARILQGNYMV